MILPNNKNKTLQAYCHYPLTWAEQEHRDSQNEMYRIVTINWTYATDRLSGSKKVDYGHVQKNIYEMTLGEFFHWWRGMEEHAEDVVSIEKIND